ncbi:MAG: ABC transporter ATP-binding protein [Patescibacteria group bacterium]
MPKTIIRAENIHKTYHMSKTNEVHALQGINLEVMEGDFSAIIGPSGCGKSTLMQILGLLDRPDSGRLYINDVDTSTMKERQAVKFRANTIGFIFQGFNLLPALTALENVMLAGRYGGLNRVEKKKRARRLLEMMGLAERLHHTPNELSGGQQQRVAIARALINSPSLILADEPTGELDSETSLEIIELLKELNEKNNQTFVLVTHNLEVANSCKKIIHLKDGKNTSA